VAAQQVARVPRIGVLAPLSREQTPKSVDDFLTGMRTLGWVDGANVSIEVRFANGDPALLSANAAAFVSEKVDVIVAFSGASAQAARRATATIPIVMDTGDDPIRSGLVASLSQPGGNVTGLTLMLPEVAAKSLQMLKEVAPRVGKIGVLAGIDTPDVQLMTQLGSAAASLGVSLLPVGVGTAEDLPRRFDEMTAAGANVISCPPRCAPTRCATPSPSSRCAFICRVWRSSAAMPRRGFCCPMVQAFRRVTSGRPTSSTGF
jgi:putative ABC transport system substrate-binding protein